MGKLQDWWENSNGVNYLFERNEQLTGIVHITRGRLASWVRLHLHPDMSQYADEMITEMVALVSNTRTRPIYVGVRDYEGGIRAGLEAAGFEWQMLRSLMVKHTTVRVRMPVPWLAPVFEPKKIPVYMHVVIECELAVRLGRDLPKAAAPYTREGVRAAVTEIMPAFELIEDRFAEYKATNALSLIADNAWNGGIVLGPATPLPSGLDLDGIGGTLLRNSREIATGKTDDPLGALAWLANQAAACDRPLMAGMVAITGSVIPTLPIAAGERFVFEIEGIGKAELSASA